MLKWDDLAVNKSSFTPQSNNRCIRMKNNLICYCFNYTEADIESDILENRKSTIEERIKAEKRAGVCECVTKNPSGK